MKRRFAIIQLFTLLLLVAAATTARGALLSDLISGDTLHVGDKFFHDFEYLKIGDMPDPDQINVVPYTDDQGDVGIEFQGAFFDALGGGASDALIKFQVSVDPEFDLLFITGATLSGNPSVIGGDGFIAVTETFLPEEPTKSLSIFDISPGATTLSDTTTFVAAHKTIHVQKDIIAFSAAIQFEPGIPTLSFIRQTFHQTIVPEPGSGTLLGIGLVALAWFRLRRK